MKNPWSFTRNNSRPVAPPAVQQVPIVDLHLPSELPQHEGHAAARPRGSRRRGSGAAPLTSLVTQHPGKLGQLQNWCPDVGRPG